MVSLDSQVSLEGTARAAEASAPGASPCGLHIPDPAAHPHGQKKGPYCQVPGCEANLMKVGCRRFFQRYRVCPEHATMPSVHISGQVQRFCQQCAHFHTLDCFDGTRKSCAKSLAKHAAGRRLREAEAAARRREAEATAQQSCAASEGVSHSLGVCTPDGSAELPALQPRSPSPTSPSPGPAITGAARGGAQLPPVCSYAALADASAPGQQERQPCPPTAAATAAAAAPVHVRRSSTSSGASGSVATTDSPSTVPTPAARLGRSRQQSPAQQEVHSAPRAAGHKRPADAQAADASRRPRKLQFANPARSPAAPAAASGMRTAPMPLHPVAWQVAAQVFPGLCQALPQLLFSGLMRSASAASPARPAAADMLRSPSPQQQPQKQQQQQQQQPQQRQQQQARAQQQQRQRQRQRAQPRQRARQQAARASGAAVAQAAVQPPVAQPLGAAIPAATFAATPVAAWVPAYQPQAPPAPASMQPHQQLQTPAGPLYLHAHVEVAEVPPTDAGAAALHAHLAVHEDPPVRVQAVPAPPCVPADWPMDSPLADADLEGAMNAGGWVDQLLSPVLGDDPFDAFLLANEFLN